MRIEVVATTAQGCIDAEKNGADRIELCMDLSCGGVTPSIGLINAVLSAVQIPVFILIRCREGDFVYSELEKIIMLEDIKTCVSLGVHGIVAGALNADFAIDEDFRDHRLASVPKIEVCSAILGGVAARCNAPAGLSPK